MPNTVEAQDHNRRCASARARALSALARRYPDEYATLRNEIGAQMGLPPVVATRKNRPRSS